MTALTAPGRLIGPVAGTGLFVPDAWQVCPARSVWAEQDASHLRERVCWVAVRRAQSEPGGSVSGFPFPRTEKGYPMAIEIIYDSLTVPETTAKSARLSG
jgi:hypothetical protein